MGRRTAKRIGEECSIVGQHLPDVVNERHREQGRRNAVLVEGIQQHGVIAIAAHTRRADEVAAVLRDMHAAEDQDVKPKKRSATPITAGSISTASICAWGSTVASAIGIEPPPRPITSSRRG
jgi:hypothetical protein